MLYVIVYGDKSHPQCDVILCDRIPARSQGRITFYDSEGEARLELLNEDIHSIHQAYFGGTPAEPSFLIDTRAASASDVLPLDVPNVGGPL